MINVSTKTGDKGRSSLANGDRLPKSDLVFEVIGDLDELNSWLGVLVNKLGAEFQPQADFLHLLQNQLFLFSAEVADAKQVQLNHKFLSLIEEKQEKLQKQMVEGWHSRFLYPGGVEAAAWLDVTRTVCRRAERHLVKLNEKKKVRPLLLKTLNRLSDYLYVLRCFVNHELDYQETEFKK